MSQSSIKCILLVMLIRYSHGTTLNEAAFTLAMNSIQQIEPDGSAVLSMNSITNGLAMLLEKARGQTAEEILKVAFGSNPREEVVNHVDQHRTTVREYNKDISVNYLDIVTLREGNTLNVQADGMINRQNLTFTRTSPNDGTATEKLNTFISKFTNGLIKNVYEHGPQKSMLILTNAMHLKADWNMALNIVGNDSFIVESDKCKVNGENPKVLYMDGQIECTQLDDNNLGAKLYRLPFVGNQLNFYIISPIGRRTLSQLATRLTGSRWIDIITRLDKVEYEYIDGEQTAKQFSVKLPIFTTRTKSSLKKILTNLGMRSMFRRDAEFSYNSSSLNVYVTEIKHEAVVRVDEKGIEGAGVTQATENKMTITPINRPFFWAVANSVTKDIYFLGRYMGPC